MPSTVPTRHNLTTDQSNLWICFLCPVKVCFGVCKVRQKLTPSRPQATQNRHREHIPISEADPESERGSRLIKIHVPVDDNNQ